MVENGNTYQWTGIMDGEYKKQQFRICFVAIGICCLVPLIVVVSICVMNRKWEMLPYGLLPALAVFGISTVCFLLYKSSGAAERLHYRMQENGITMVTINWRGNAYFFFQSAKRVVFTKTYIENKVWIGGFRVYVPEEDMPFVKQYVLYRLPSDCEIEDLSYLG